MISIIIPNRSDLRIRKLFQSLLDAQLEQYTEEIKVVISLNQPTAEVKELVLDLESEYPKLIETIMTEERGIAHAKNNAIRHLIKISDYFVFIDSDCTVRSDYLQKLTHYTREKPMAVRGYINFIPKQNSYLSRQNSRVRNSTNFLYPEAFFTPNLILSKHVFENVGLYDIRIKYGDDLEFGQRAKIMGFQINFKNDLIVDHYDNPSFLRKTLRTWWGYGADRGFRLVREMRLNQYGLLNKLRLIFEFKKYWFTNRFDDFLFSTFYLVVARASALASVIKLQHKPDEYFTSYPTLTGIKTLGIIIRSQTTTDTQ